MINCVLINCKCDGIHLPSFVLNCMQCSYGGHEENIHSLTKTEDVLVDIRYLMMNKKNLTRSNNAITIAFHVVIKIWKHTWTCNCNYCVGIFFLPFICTIHFSQVAHLIQAILPAFHKIAMNYALVRPWNCMIITVKLQFTGVKQRFSIFPVHR